MPRPKMDLVEVHESQFRTVLLCEIDKITATPCEFPPGYEVRFSRNVQHIKHGYRLEVHVPAKLIPSS